MAKGLLEGQAPGVVARVRSLKAYFPRRLPTARLVVEGGQLPGAEPLFLLRIQVIEGAPFHAAGPVLATFAQQTIGQSLQFVEFRPFGRAVPGERGRAPAQMDVQAALRHCGREIAPGVLVDAGGQILAVLHPPFQVTQFQIFCIHFALFGHGRLHGLWGCSDAQRQSQAQREQDCAESGNVSCFHITFSLRLE